MKYYEAYFAKDGEEIKVFDIGSYDMGGTYKEIFQESRYHYTGMDMTEGSNVDIIPKDIYCWEEIEDETFDLVISGQAFEHIEYPYNCIITASHSAASEIKKKLQNAGIEYRTLYLNNEK